MVRWLFQYYIIITICSADQGINDKLIKQKLFEMDHHTFLWKWVSRWKMQIHGLQNYPYIYVIYVLLILEKPNAHQRSFAKFRAQKAKTNLWVSGKCSIRHQNSILFLWRQKLNAIFRKRSAILLCENATLENFRPFPDNATKFLSPKKEHTVHGELDLLFQNLRMIWDFLNDNTLQNNFVQGFDKGLFNKIVLLKNVLWWACCGLN